MKPIKDFENYFATTDGRIWSQKSCKFLAGGLDRDGYRLVTLCKDGERATAKVHRLIAEAFIPNPQSLPVVHHIDGDKQNNCVSNLQWATVSYNTSQSYVMGVLDQKGEANNACLYSDDIVAKVRDNYSGGNIAEYARSLGLPYSVVYSYIRKLRRLG